MKRILSTALGVAGMLGVLSLPAHAAGVSKTPDTQPQRCVTLTRIDYTHVVDDQSILFYMYGGDIYLNKLSHATPGLDRQQPFMYKTSLSRLCENDLITVLEDRGFGFTPGATTALGKFEPIDEAAAVALRAGKTANVETEAVEPK